MEPSGRFSETLKTIVSSLVLSGAIVFGLQKCSSERLEDSLNSSFVEGAVTNYFPSSYDLPSCNSQQTYRFNPIIFKNSQEN
jgi:hypothetical protein